MDRTVPGLTPGVITLNGVSNQAATTTTAPNAPVGYALVEAGLTNTNTQPVMWTTVNGKLVTPDIYFYYRAIKRPKQRLITRQPQVAATSMATSQQGQ